MSSATGDELLTEHVVEASSTRAPPTLTEEEKRKKKHQKVGDETKRKKKKKNQSKTKEEEAEKKAMVKSQTNSDPSESSYSTTITTTHDVDESAANTVTSETGIVQEKKENIMKKETAGPSSSGGVRKSSIKQKESKEQETQKVVSSTVKNSPHSSTSERAAAAAPRTIAKAAAAIPAVATEPMEPARSSEFRPSDCKKRSSSSSNGGERRPAGRLSFEARRKKIPDDDAVDVEIGGGGGDFNANDKAPSQDEECIKEIFEKGVDQEQQEKDGAGNDDDDDHYGYPIPATASQPGAFNIRGNRQPSMQSTVMSTSTFALDTTSTASHYNNPNNDTAPVISDADLDTPLVAHLVQDENELSFKKIVVAVEEDTELLRRRQRRFLVTTALVVFLVVVIILVGVILAVKKMAPSPTTATAEPEELWYNVIEPIDGDRDSDFGSSVSMCSDGSRVAIGAQGTGEVKVYELDVKGARSKQIGQTLQHNVDDNVMMASNTSIIMSRIVVELASDCHVLAIGCPFCNADNMTSAGQVGLYEYNSTSDSWEPLGNPHIIAGRNESDYCGASLALSRTGDRIVIGSPGSDKAGVNAGVVRVYHINQDKWELLGKSIRGTFSGEEFGGSVSLANKQSSATSIIAVGSSFRKETCRGQESSPEAVRVYEFMTGAWSQLGQGIVPEVFQNDTAWYVKLSSDGKKLVVSNHYVDPDGIGISEDNESLYVAAFEFDSQNKKWVPRGGNLHRSIAGKKSGYMISLSDDGQMIGMGDPGKEGAGGIFSGHAHFFQFTGDTWCQLGPKILGAAPGDMAGYSVSISGDGKRMAVSSPKSRFQGYEHGRVLVVELHEDRVELTCNVTSPHSTDEGGPLSLCSDRG